MDEYRQAAMVYGQGSVAHRETAALTNHLSLSLALSGVQSTALWVN